jgi:predicted  nucleic acid-binding Zn-ribbon protein
MALELVYTSAPQGLRPGSSGFCTVALTRGMPAPMIGQLEALSAYRPLFSAGTPDETRNPVSYAHTRANIGGRLYSILSLVRFAGTDYSQRSNKFAHHLALGPEELPAGGPAWLVRQPGVLDKNWDGQPRHINEPRSIPLGDRPATICMQWAAVTGDAGWAGVVAERFVLDATKPVYLLYEVGQDVLSLFEEVIALLPPAARWRATFNTYLSQLPSGLACTWRGCVVGSRAAVEARQVGGALVIDLTHPQGSPHESRYVELARQGKTVQPVVVPEAETPVRPIELWPAPSDPNPEEDQLDIPESRYADFTQPDPVRRAQPSLRIPIWFWGVALAWPILILCVVLIVTRQQYQAEDVASVEYDDSTERRIARLIAERDALESENLSLLDQLDELTERLQHLSEARSPQQTNSRSTPQPSRNSPNTQSAKRPSPQRTLPERVTQTPRRDVDRSTRPLMPTSDKRPLARRISGLFDHWAVDLPKLVHGSLGVTARAMPLMDNVPSAAAVQLKLPNSSRQASRDGRSAFEIESSSDGPRVLMALPDDAPHRWAEVARVYVDDQTMWWAWRVPNSVIGRSEDVALLDTLISGATLSIRQNSGQSQTLQFIQPQRKVVSIDQAEPKAAIQTNLADIAIEIGRYPLGWTVHQEPTARTRVSLTGRQGLELEFHLTLLRDEAVVRPHWPAGDRPDQLFINSGDQVTVAKFELDTARSRHDRASRDVQRDLKRVKAELAAAKQPDRQESLLREQGRLEERLQAIEADWAAAEASYQQIQNRHDQLKEQLSDYHALDVISMNLVQPSSGAVVAMIEFRASGQASLAGGD